MTTRAEALAILEERDKQLQALLAELPEDALTAPGTIGGGEWSARDLIGHLAFWEELALRELEAWRAGTRSAPWDVDVLNAENQERSRDMPLHEVRRRYATAHLALLRAIEAMPDAEWAESRAHGGGEISLGDALGRVTGGPRSAFDHADAHLPDLQTFVEARR
jgi:hypothetical protein